MSENSSARRRGEGPDPVDVAIGRHIRARRVLVGLTQAELGATIGVTFQQIQKYERGTNRISMSMFVRICNALRTSPNVFFSQLDAFDPHSRLEAIGEEEAAILAALTKFQRQSPGAYRALLGVIKAWIPSADVYPDQMLRDDPDMLSPTPDERTSPDYFGEPAHQREWAEGVLGNTPRRLQQKIKTRIRRGMSSAEISAEIMCDYKMVDAVFQALAVAERNFKEK